MIRLIRTAMCVAALALVAIRGAGAQQAAPAAPPAPAFDQALAIAELKKAIAGKEELLAPEVFKNIKQYKGVTAGRLLRIMEYGFTRSLGVDCTHCHVAGQWDLDEKVTKQIAREMSAMMVIINGEYLKKIPNLKSTNASVNCTTCHRGQTRPALELPPAAKPAAQQ